MNHELSRRDQAIEAFMVSVEILMNLREVPETPGGDGSFSRTIDLTGYELVEAKRIMESVDGKRPNKLSLMHVSHPEDDAGDQHADAYQSVSAEVTYDDAIKHYLVLPDLASELYGQTTHLTISVELEPIVAIRSLEERQSDLDRWLALPQKIRNQAEQDVSERVTTREVDVLNSVVSLLSWRGGPAA